ncbi:hypothetical protein [Streptomyces syringium]|uniref:hypothetical protein n=1 Tax=Streptomyces syringium TaxID=76729 RepID=UPI00342E20DA
MDSDSFEDLTSLLRWDSPLDGLVNAAKQHDLQDGPYVILNRPTARDVVQRCISGELDVSELPRWAGVVHMLERVEIDEADIEQLAQFLFEVSSPGLFEPITVEVCRRWASRLS